MKEALALLCMCCVPAQALDQSPWDRLVKQYVNSEARVDYGRWKQDGLKDLDGYLAGVAAPWSTGMPGNEVKAALIDAYNALTVRWVLRNYPVESIWKTSHPFTEARHVVNGEKVSLDAIEGRLRKMGDARIHGALVCAARSCPPLRREAYTGAALDGQLDSNFRTWLANTKLNQFLPNEKAAQVSEIFKWYEKDFAASEGSVEKMLAKYAPAGQGAFLLQPGAVVKFNSYHWGLNDATSLGENYSKLALYWDHLRNH